MMIWRLARDCLPTKVNLRKINIIGEQDTRCCCNEVPEMAAHLFLDYVKVNCLWKKISSWLGVSWAEPPGGCNTSRLLLQSVGRRTISKKIGRLMGLCDLEMEKLGDFRRKRVGL